MSHLRMRLLPYALLLLSSGLLHSQSGSANDSRDAGSATGVAEARLSADGLSSAAPDTRAVLFCADEELLLWLDSQPKAPPCDFEAGTLVWTRLRQGPVSIYEVGTAAGSTELELLPLHVPEGRDGAQLVLMLAGASPGERIDGDVWWRARARDEWLPMPLSILAPPDLWGAQRVGLVEDGADGAEVRMVGLTEGQVSVSVSLGDIEGETPLPVRVPPAGNVRVPIDLAVRSSVCGAIVTDRPERGWTLRVVDRATEEERLLGLEEPEFCFESYEGREYRLTATAGITEGPVTLTYGGDQGVLVTAPRVDRITVRLVTRSAASLAGDAKVVWGRDGPALQKVSFDDSGEFAFDRPSVAFHLDVDAPCCSEVSLTFDDPDIVPDHLEIDLDSPVSVTLSPVDAETGTSLSAVTGRATCPEEGRTMSVACSVDGDDLLCGLPVDAPCSVLLTREGYVPRQLDIEPVSDDVALEVELSQGMAFGGRVVDSSGAALSRVGVKLLHPNGARTHDASTDPQGRFRFTGLSQGRHLLMLESDGRRLARPVDVRPDSPERDWVLETGLPWRSRVSGLPPRSAVPARVILSAGADTWEARTVARGEFTVESGPRGNVAYTVTHPTFRGDICTGSVLAEAPVVEVELDCPLGRFDVDFILELPADTRLKLVEQASSQREHLAASRGNRHSFANVLGGPYALLSIDAEGHSALLWQGDIFETMEIRP